MMTDSDVMRSLEQLRHDSQRWRAKLDRAIRHGQSTKDGQDESGAVTVVLDDDGAACDVRFAADWRRRLAPDDLAGAVCSADADAAQRRALATTEALARLDQAEERSTLDADAPGVPVDPLRSAAAGVPRTIGQLTAATWSALDDLAQASTPQPPVTGVGAAGGVRLRVSAGRIVECVLDPRWRDRQDATGLADGVREALSTARTATTTARRPATELQRRLSELLADVHATMAARTAGRL